MKNEIIFKGGFGYTFEDAVSELLEAKADGKHVYGYFNQYLLDSDVIDSIDDAYQIVFGHTKEETERQQQEMIRQNNERINQEKQARQIREDNYAKMISSARKPGQVVLITMPIVINGLKFIAENQNLSQKELIKGLLDLGCNFTLDEINKQFPNSNASFGEIKKDDPSLGATVIVQVRDSELGREYCNERLLSVDDNISIYHLIRILTNNPNYTKASIMNQKSTDNTSHTNTTLKKNPKGNNIIRIK